MKSPQDIREYVEQQLEQMRTKRNPWFTHWQELADNILPRRMEYLISPNSQKSSLGMNKKIVDPTGTSAARVCAAGMMTGVNSPARPWFRLAVGDVTANQDTGSPEAQWLWDVEKRAEAVLAQSNVYNSLAGAHQDNVVFGSAPIFIYEDYEDVIRAYPCVVGEYFLAVDDRNFPCIIAREFSLSVRAIVKWFSYENCPPDIQSAYDQKSMNQEWTVCHYCEPNTEGWVRKAFKFWECYWIKGSPRDKTLRTKGFFEQPFVCMRWDVLGASPYASSPGMDALPEIKQLFHETNRKAQAIDKMVSPPVVADVAIRNQPTSLLPGGVTYVSGASQIGVKPIFTVQPPIQEMMGDIQEIQNRIKTIFYNDLFMMISQLDTVRTATEIAERREEKLIMLGPVLDRLQNECLDPLITRIFNIMWRGRLLPNPPESIRGREIKVQYVSMLAEAQAASKTIAIERVVGFAGTVAAGAPDVLDRIDVDKAVVLYAEGLRVPAPMIRPDEQVTEMRKAREQERQAATLLDQTQAGANAAKTMSQAEIGGGQNALTAIAGGMADAAA